MKAEEIRTIFVFGSNTLNAILKENLLASREIHTKLNVLIACVWKRENAGLGKMTTVGGAFLLLHVFLCMCGCIYPGLHADMTLSIHRLNWKPEWKQTKPVCVPSFVGYLICGAMSKISTRPPLPCETAIRLPVSDQVLSLMQPVGMTELGGVYTGQHPILRTTEL